MVYGKNLIWTAALLFAASPVAMIAQPAQTQTPAPAQQKQDIPDAPRPQTLPNLKTITPIGAAITPPVPSEQATPAAPTAPAAAQQPDEDQGPPPEPGINSFRIIQNINFVEVPFIVKDSKGQLVPGIPSREVSVYENNVLQHVSNFTTDPFPLSVALVIDQSVTYDIMDKINASLAALQGAFAPYDEVAVFTYNNGVREQTAFTAAQGARLGVILDRSKGHGREPMLPGGGPLSNSINKNGSPIDSNTSGHPGNRTFDQPEKEFHTLNDAILAAARETARAPKGRRRIVYVISDGKEYGSSAKEKDVIKYCLTNNVSVWATLVGDSSIYGLGFVDHIHIPFMMRDNVLNRYTAATAGQFDAEFRQKGIEASFGKITAEARNQYTVGYYSHEPALDGKYRKVDVRVARPNLTIFAKEGYWPRPSTPQPPAPVTPTAIP